MVKLVLLNEKALIRKLQDLPVKLQDRVLKSAAHNAMKPVLSAARSKVPVLYGLLKKALGIKSKLYRRNHTAIALAGARKGFGTEKTVEIAGKSMTTRRDPRHYSHLAERGTKAHEQPALKIQHPGAAPRPFLEPGFEQAKPAMIARFGREIGKGLDRIARRSVR